jgi:ATP-dependent Clp protease ATP-binding subunit ClpC
MTRMSKYVYYYKYSKEAREVISLAREEALRLRHRLIGTEHLFLSMLRLNHPLIESLFVSLNTSSAGILQALDFVIGRGRRALVSDPVLSTAARATLARAEEVALVTQADLVGIEHVLLGMLDERDGIVMGVLENLNIYPELVRYQLRVLTVKGYEHLVSSIKYRELYDNTPALNLVSRDLTLEALNNQLDPLIGREAELERTMQILSRRAKNNPVLIGPSGVGKTAIAEGLACRVIQGKVPESLLHCRVVALNLGLLTLGTKFRGDFEERLKSILHEMSLVSNIIIVIEELHALLQTGATEGSLDAANLFKPLLARGILHCIGTATLDEYRKIIEGDPALERRFQPVSVNETNEQETLRILYGLRSRYEEFHQVTIKDEALHAAVRLSSRYIQGRHQPDNALDLIDEAASRICVRRSIAPENVRRLRAEMAHLQREKELAISERDFAQAASFLKEERRTRQELHQAERKWQLFHQQERPGMYERDVTELVASRTGLPLGSLSQEERQHLLNLEQDLHKLVIGQDTAVSAVARAMRRWRARVGDEHRPIGSFLFVGPTGVGKTELARALAIALFGDERALLKLDMSEFMEYHQISRLLGTPAGYVGHDQAGQLTEAIRRRPYSIVLFDEIEKAHTKIVDILLQILEDGCLTDAHGQTVSFKQAVVIITSNLGTSHQTPAPLSFVPAQKAVTSSPDQAHMNRRIALALRETFRPELLNRIDEIVTFHVLQSKHVRQIVDLMVARVQRQLAEQAIDLRITDAACAFLAKEGYDVVYGAKQLRRTVQVLLEDKLAEAILLGTCHPGDIVEVNACNEQQIQLRVITYEGQHVA